MTYDHNHYSIGSSHVPGLSKLIEEAGEVTQVAGKIIGLGHMGNHWDGTNMKTRMEEELADLKAAMLFFIWQNELDSDAIDARCREKYQLFNKWHAEYDL